MINVKQISDGSFDISWDPNDPKEQQLNYLTEHDFVNLIQQKLNSLVPSKPDPWFYMVAHDLQTGGGETVCIMMIPANSIERNAIEIFTSRFGSYYSKLMTFVSRDEFFATYKNFIPKNLHDIKDNLCTIVFYTKFHVNYA